LRKRIGGVDHRHLAAVAAAQQRVLVSRLRLAWLEHRAQRVGTRRRLGSVQQLADQLRGSAHGLRCDCACACLPSLVSSSMAVWCAPG
jgi:hypothetical protein